MQARVIIFLIFALFVAVFAVINIQTVVIDFFFGQYEIQLIFVIIFSILIGALLMFILSSMKHIQFSRKIKSLDKENAKLEKELEVIKAKEIEEQPKEVEEQQKGQDNEDVKN